MNEVNSYILMVFKKLASINWNRALDASFHRADAFLS